MRRTFNDVARRAKLESIVIKSVSGHLTDRMKQHYSTVGEEEQREGLGLVLSRVKAEGVEIVKTAVSESTKTSEGSSSAPGKANGVSDANAPTSEQAHEPGEPTLPALPSDPQTPS